MADFNLAIQPTLEEEGSAYTNDPTDRGGPTRHGITLATLRRYRKDPNLGPVAVQHLTEDEAKAIYRALYWHPLYDKLASQRMGWRLFDAGVNMGPSRAVKLLQEALKKMGHPVTVDGVFGQQTLAYTNCTDEVPLFHAMCDEMAEFYLDIIARDPSQARFKNGWLARAYRGDELA
jgi:lysozyme family protein